MFIDYKKFSMWNNYLKISPIVQKVNMELQTFLEIFRKILSYFKMFKFSKLYPCEQLLTQHENALIYVVG